MPVFEGWPILVGARAQNNDNPRRRDILADCGELCGCICTLITIFIILDIIASIYLTRIDVKYLRAHMLQLNSTSEHLYLVHLNNTH